MKIIVKRGRVWTGREQQAKRTVWMADIQGLPGSPAMGTGNTVAQAVANAFLANLSLECYQNTLIRIAQNAVELQEVTFIVKSDD